MTADNEIAAMGGQRELSGQEQARAIYEQYQKGVDYLNKFGLYENTEEAYRMFEGDQWHGLNSGGERLPFYNVIQPIVEYKVASVASNRMAMIYTPMGVMPQRRQEYEEACKLLNSYAAQQWELLKMDALSWELLKDACISGSGCLYFSMENDGAPRLAVQSADAVNVHLANEQEEDLQAQHYIIIAERRPVRDIRAEARASGVPEEEIAAIRSDDETRHILGLEAKQEIETAQDGGGKCLSLLKMRKAGGVVYFSRSTRDCLYQPERAIEGLRLYPMAQLAWLRKKNSARGTGEAMPLVANQLEINKNLARRSMASKLSAYARLVYNSQMISDPRQLEQIGGAISVDGPVAKVHDAITYLSPQNMSGDAKQLSDELMNITKELAGAGEAALGQVNPEKASGAAIIAVRDQASLPLNKQVADYRQFVEDVAAVWYDMWAAYYTNGLPVEVELESGKAQRFIAAATLRGMDVHIRIDVSPANPLTKYAQEQALERLFLKGDLTFEEYVETLDEDSAVPKGKLEEVLRKRQLARGNGQLPMGAAPGLPPRRRPSLPPAPRATTPASEGGMGWQDAATMG